jgi:hypothetical protein
MHALRTGHAPLDHLTNPQGPKAVTLHERAQAVVVALRTLGCRLTEPA